MLLPTYLSTFLTKLHLHSKVNKVFSTILLGHQKQICKILWNMSNAKGMLLYCVALLFFHFSGDWESEDVAWNFCILIFPYPVRMMLLVLCFFSYRELLSCLLSHLDSPALLSNKIIIQNQNVLLEIFIIFIFPPPVTWGMWLFLYFTSLLLTYFPLSPIWVPS